MIESFFMKENLKGTISSAQSVKGKLLMLVLPIVIIGLIVMCSASFYMMESAFEREIISNAEKNVSEVSSGVSACLTHESWKHILRLIHRRFVTFLQVKTI